MISGLTLADRDGNDVVLQSASTPFKRNVVSITGLLGVPPQRVVTRPRPVGHGGIDDTRWSEGSLINLIGEVISTVSVEDAWTEFGALIVPMQDTLDSGPALLKWREGATGTQLQRTVKLASDVDPPVENPGAILNYQAQFYSPDPRAYSQTLQTVSGIALSASSGGLTFPIKFPIKFNSTTGGTVTLTNNGNRQTPPVFRIYGGCTNPAIVNLTTGERMTFAGIIDNGDFLEIGTDPGGQRYAKYNGSIPANNMVDSANTAWWDLGRGTTNLQLIAGLELIAGHPPDGRARLDVLFRDAWA